MDKYRKNDGNTDAEETMFFQASQAGKSTDQYDTQQMNARQIRQQAAQQAGQNSYPGSGYGQNTPYGNHPPEGGYAQNPYASQGYGPEGYSRPNYPQQNYGGTGRWLSSGRQSPRRLCWPKWVRKSSGVQRTAECGIRRIPAVFQFGRLFCRRKRAAPAKPSGFWCTPGTASGAAERTAF